MRRHLSIVLLVLTAGRVASADGFHEPPFRGTTPERWEREIRTKLKIPARRATLTGPGADKAPPPAPDGPGLTTEELGPVVVRLIDLLRYLNPRNVNPGEFPEVAERIPDYRSAIKRLLADLGEKGVGYLVEALVCELRDRRRGDGRRIPEELLGRKRADRTTWGTTGDDDLHASPEYVDDLIEVLRQVGWPALRECLDRRAKTDDDAVRGDLERFLVETARRVPRLFLPALAEGAEPEVRREGLAALVVALRGPALANDRDLSDRVVEGLVLDLRAVEPDRREWAAAGLRDLLGQEFGGDQTRWRAFWHSTAPALCSGPNGIPELIERLGVEDPLARVTAARNLRKLAKTDLGMDEEHWARPLAPKARAEGQKRWREWWERSREKVSAEGGK
ncbi:MAG: hypothetical protein L0216_07045 [Planctomycetales bacterium]|nr:hypothetical protein [Planctomycetales bacterium]